MEIKLTKDIFVEGQIIEAGTVVRVTESGRGDIPLSKALGGTLIYIDDSAERVSLKDLLTSIVEYNSNIWLGSADYIPAVIIADTEYNALEYLEDDMRDGDYETEVQLDGITQVNTSIKDRSVETLWLDSEGQELDTSVASFSSDYNIPELIRFIQDTRQSKLFMKGTFTWSARDSYQAKSFRHSSQLILRWESEEEGIFLMSISWNDKGDILREEEKAFYGSIWTGETSFDY